MSRELAQDWLSRAIALCDLGRLEDADEALREALREDPNDPVTHGVLALVLMDLDRPKEALEASSRAIALGPELSLGHTARTRALLALERFEEAEASANEAIRLDPEDADGYVLLAFALLGRERWDEALAAADKALSLEPESESARGVRAVALGWSKGGPGWQEAADETLAVAPDSALAHAFAGETYLRRGGEREAAERFREALRLDPESEFAQAGLAEAMKAAHPLFKPLFRFFMWQERLSNGWKAAIIVGPLLALRALRPAADNPLFLPDHPLGCVRRAHVAGRAARKRRASLFQGRPRRSACGTKALVRSVPRLPRSYRSRRRPGAGGRPTLLPHRPHDGVARVRRRKCTRPAAQAATHRLRLCDRGGRRGLRRCGAHGGRGGDSRLRPGRHCTAVSDRAALGRPPRLTPYALAVGPRDRSATEGRI